MTFLEAYAEFGPDTMAIAEAMGVPEHKADSLVNAKMDRERLGPTAVQRVVQVPAPKIIRKRVPYAGFDRKEHEQLVRR